MHGMNLPAFVLAMITASQDAPTFESTQVGDGTRRGRDNNKIYTVRTAPRHAGVMSTHTCMLFNCNSSVILLLLFPTVHETFYSACDQTVV
jgi:hypothetical protein